MTQEYAKALKELTDEANKLYIRLERGFQEDNIIVLAKELGERITIIARAGKRKADARWFLDTTRGILQTDPHRPKNPTQMKEWIAGKLANEQRVYDMWERLNAILAHQIDGLRTLLSTEKEHMIQSGKGTPQGGRQPDIHIQPEPEER